MKTIKKSPTNKIGYKDYNTTNEVGENNLPAKAENSPEEKTYPISPAQADLCETIQSLFEMIIDKDFTKNFNDNQRKNFVSQLVNSVALNTEITTKTSLLIY